MITANTSYNADDLEYFQDEFIKPLERLGFNFLGIGGIHRDTEIGAHVLFFEHDSDIDFSDEDLQRICIKDDDPTGGLFSSYHFRYYFGTLWVFVPYVS